MPAIPHLKLAALVIGLVGVGGFAALLVAAGHHPQEAAFLRIMAVVWLLSCGATKLLVALTETAGRGGDHDGGIV